jgi:hypothetical protein
MEIKEKLQELVDARGKEKYIHNFESKIVVDPKNTTVTIEVSCMYHLDGFISFAFLSQISELLSTKDISLQDEYYTPGCDTCDFGSSSSASIVATNCKGI